MSQYMKIPQRVWLVMVPGLIYGRFFKKCQKLAKKWTFSNGHSSSPVSGIELVFSPICSHKKRVSEIEKKFWKFWKFWFREFFDQKRVFGQNRKVPTILAKFFFAHHNHHSISNLLSYFPRNHFFVALLLIFKWKSKIWISAILACFFQVNQMWLPKMAWKSPRSHDLDNLGPIHPLSDHLSNVWLLGVTKRG